MIIMGMQCFFRKDKHEHGKEAGSCNLPNML